MYQVRPAPVIRIAPSPERLISYMRSFDDVWFGTLSEACDCRTEDSATLAGSRRPPAPTRPLSR